MPAARVILIQAHPDVAARAQAAAQPSVAGVSGDQIRNQIRQSIQDVNRAVAESQDLREEINEAQQHVREAQQHLREARTDDQRGAAQQELFGAQTELSALQGVSRLTIHTGQPMPFAQDMIPPQVVDMSIAFFIMLAVIIIGWPIARAMGRRIERRAETPALPDPALTGQLQRIEQAVEAMSIEIERISESQRFLTKLQSGAGERTSLGAGERR